MLRGCVHPAAVYAAVLSFAASLTLTGSLPLLHGKVVAPRLAAGRGKLGCQFDEEANSAGQWTAFSGAPFPFAHLFAHWY
jgi:hypothetical protein